MITPTIFSEYQVAFCAFENVTLLTLLLSGLTSGVGLCGSNTSGSMKSTSSFFLKYQFELNLDKEVDFQFLIGLVS